MMKAAKGKTCTAMEMDMEMSMSMAFPPEMELDVGPMDMSLAASITVTMNDNPYADHMTMKMDMSMMGEETSSQLESYTVVEDGTLVSYSGTDGLWLRAATGETPESIQSLQQEISALVPSSGDVELKLDETVTAYKDQPAVCLTYTITGQDVEPVLDKMLTAMGENSDLAEVMKNLDWSAISYHGRVYVDTVTYLPIATEMEITGADQLFASLFADTGMTVSMGTFTATVKYTSFDPQAPIVVPEEVKSSATAE